MREMVLKSLRDMTVSRISFVGCEDVGVIDTNLVRSIRGINSLDFSGCYDMNDDAIYEMKDLRILNLELCWKVTYVGLNYLKNWKN